jgi:hypothetical protein
MLLKENVSIVFINFGLSSINPINHWHWQIADQFWLILTGFKDDLTNYTTILIKLNTLKTKLMVDFQFLNLTQCLINLNIYNELFN